MSKILILVGVILIAAGLVFKFGAKYVGWLGKLPGDIRIEREHFSFYFPITTLILISVLINLAIKIFSKFKM